MGQKIKKLKKIRLHREGTDQLVTGAIALVAIAAILWTTLDNKIPFWAKYSAGYGDHSRSLPDCGKGCRSNAKMRTKE